MASLTFENWVNADQKRAIVVHLLMRKREFHVDYVGSASRQKEANYTK
jgi:hypothetical protein